MTRRIIAVDPGKMTGIAFFDHEPGQEPVLVWSGEVDEDEFYRTVCGGFGDIFDDMGNVLPDANVVLVCEAFTITIETAKKAQAPYSLELIGVLKHILRENSDFIATPLIMQKPGDAKAVFTNEKLKKLGYWHVGGAGHANDAIRHGLLYLAKNGWTPARLLD